MIQLPVLKTDGFCFSFVCGRDFLNVAIFKRELASELRALCEILISTCANMNQIRSALADFIEANSKEAA